MKISHANYLNPGAKCKLHRITRPAASTAKCEISEIKASLEPGANCEIHGIMAIGGASAKCEFDLWAHFPH